MDELSGLGEYSSMNYCLNEIPQRVRQGLSIVDVHFTCFDVVEEFIVIGTNIGVTYWCNRKTNKIERLRPEKRGPAITAVKVVSTVDYMVATGDHSGTVSIFVIPKAKPVFLPADHENAKRGIERFTAADLHLSPISAMVWSANGQKLFTGDEKGVVAYTEMDFQLNIIKSREILNEKFYIVQLAYRSQILVIASEYRCIIYKQNSGQSEPQIHQVGQEERGSLQRLGALIGSHSSQPEFVVFSARPKQKIWIANGEGNVCSTLLFKDPLAQSYPEIRISHLVGTTELQSKESSLMNSADGSAESSSSFNCDIEFNFLHRYKNKYLLVHDGHSLVLLNPETTSVEAGFVVTELLSAAVNKDEIFVLEGCRRIRRLSFSADPYSASEFYPVHSEIPIGDKLLGIVQETSTNMVQSMIENLKKIENVVNSQSPYGTLVEDLSPAEEALNLCYTKKQQPQEHSTQHLRTSYDVDSNCDDIVHNRQRKKLQPLVLEDKGFESEALNHNDSNSSQDREQPEGVNSIEQNSLELLGEVPKDIMPDLRTPTTILNDVEYKELLLAKLLSREEELPSTNRLENLHITKDTESSSSDEILLPETEDREETFVESSETERESAEVDTECTEETSEAQVSDDCVSNESGDVPSEFSKELSNIRAALIHSFCEKYWKQYRVSVPIKWICVSRSDVFCGSIKQSVHQSSCRSGQFKLVKQKCRASRMIVSQSGNIVWKLDLGVLYTLKDADDPNPWKLVARNVESAAVNDWSAWYISGKEIFVQTGLSKKKTFGESTRLKCFSDPSRICCFENNVWLLTVNGIILNRELVSEQNPLGNNWKVVSHPDTISISDIALGTRGTGWIIDKLNNIYFSDDFTGDEANWWQVMIDRRIYLSDSTSFWSKDKPLSTIGSGSDSIWITASNENVIFVNRTAVLGHNWMEIPISTSVVYKTKWKLLAAAGEREQTASLWCLSSSNDLFLYMAQRNSIRPVEMPTTNDIISMSAVPDMMWILTDKNEIFVRRCISEQTPFGWTWERLQIYQIENSISSFKHLSIGRDVIWAVSADYKIYAAVADLYAITSETFVLDWISLEHSLPPESKFVDVVVGPNKYMVWALDSKCNVYTRQSIFDKFPFGTEWISVPGIKAVRLTVSPSAVWALTADGNVYRRSNITAEDPMGEHWSQIPGGLSLITASVFEDMWGVSKQTGRLLKYENHLLALKADFIRDRTSSENTEDGWEMVEEANIYQVDD